MDTFVDSSGLHEKVLIEKKNFKKEITQRLFYRLQMEITKKDTHFFHSTLQSSHGGFDSLACLQLQHVADAAQ